MTDVSHDSANPPSKWLPEGLGPHSDDETRSRRNRETVIADPIIPPAPASLEQLDPEIQEWLLDDSRPPPPRAAKPAKQVEPVDAHPTEEALAEQRTRIAELEETLEQREAEFEETLREREAEFAQAFRERDQALKEREAELEERVGKRHEERQAELDEQFERQQVELEEQLAVLEERLDTREAELREHARREEELEGRIEELESALAERRQEATPRSEAPPTPETRPQEKPRRSRRRTSTSESGDLDINGATFEQLRELGLTVTQSARVIAYRDTRGGFDSLDELDEIPGLPKETRGTLRSKLRL